MSKQQQTEKPFEQLKEEQLDSVTGGNFVEGDEWGIVSGLSLGGACSTKPDTEAK